MGTVKSNPSSNPDRNRDAEYALIRINASPIAFGPGFTLQQVPCCCGCTPDIYLIHYITVSYREISQQRSNIESPNLVYYT